MLRNRDDGWQRCGRLAVYGMSKRRFPPTDRSAPRPFVGRISIDRASGSQPTAMKERRQTGDPRIVSKGQALSNFAQRKRSAYGGMASVCHRSCIHRSGTQRTRQVISHAAHRGPRRDRKRQATKWVLCVRRMHKASPIHTTSSHTTAKSAKPYARSQRLPTIQVDSLHPPLSF